MSDPSGARLACPLSPFCPLSPLRLISPFRPRSPLCPLSLLCPTRPPAPAAGCEVLTVTADGSGAALKPGRVAEGAPSLPPQRHSRPPNAAMGVGLLAAASLEPAQRVRPLSKFHSAVPPRTTTTITDPVPPPSRIVPWQQGRPVSGGGRKLIHNTPAADRPENWSALLLRAGRSVY